MRHCPLCGGDFPDDTRMVMMRGSNICVPCSQTPRGQREIDPNARYAGYRPGSHVRGDRFRKAVEHWQKQPTPPKS